MQGSRHFWPIHARSSGQSLSTVHSGLGAEILHYIWHAKDGAGSIVVKLKAGKIAIFQSVERGNDVRKKAGRLCLSSLFWT